MFVEAGAEHVPRLGTVLVLAALVLAGDGDAGRDMRQPHGGFHLVDVLPARAAGAERIDAHVLLLDHDVDVFIYHRIDPCAGEARMPPGIRIKRRNPHQPVDAGFRLRPAIGIVTRKADGGGFDPRLVAGLFVDDFGLEAATLAPADIHAVEHERPVLAFRATRAGMDFDEAIILVGLAGEQRLEFHFADFVDDGFKRRLRFSAHCGIALSLGHFVKFQRILEAVGDAAEIGNELFHPRALAQNLLRSLLIVPQIRVLRLGVELGGLFYEVVIVKGTSRAGLGRLRTGL